MRNRGITLVCPLLAFSTIGILAAYALPLASTEESCCTDGVLDITAYRDSHSPATASRRSGPSADGTTMHVEAIAVNFQNVGGPNRQPHAYVYVRDEFGFAVDGAKVTGNWSGCFNQKGVPALTNTYYDAGGNVTAAGVADLVGKKYSCWGRAYSCNFTFTVAGVAKDGMSYDPAANVISTQGTPCW